MLDRIPGLWLVVIFSLLSSLQDAYLGSFFQSFDPALLSWLMAWIVVISLVVFNFGRWLNLLAKVRAAWILIVLLNLFTAGAWLSLFYALKWLEPASVGTLTVGLTPAVSRIIYPLFRLRYELTPPEKRASIAIGICALGLAYLALKGTGGMAAHPQTWLGLLATSICALSTSVVILLMKRIYDEGFSAREVLAVRFWGYALIATFFVADFSVLQTLQSSFYLQVTVLAFFVLVIPLYLLQVGLSRCEPLPATIILSSCPLIILILERFDQRLQVSWPAISLIVLSFAFTVYGTIEKMKLAPSDDQSSSRSSR